MSKSIKLNDDTYIDATGVKDTTYGMSQHEMNATIPFSYDFSSGDFNGMATQHTVQFGCVYAQSGGWTITNWIGQEDGYYFRVGFICFAAGGWSGKLYYKKYWGGVWTAWKEITFS